MRVERSEYRVSDYRKQAGDARLKAERRALHKCRPMLRSISSALLASPASSCPTIGGRLPTRCRTSNLLRLITGCPSRGGRRGETMMVVWYWLLFVFSIGGGLGFLVGTFVTVCRQNSRADQWDGPA